MTIRAGGEKNEHAADHPSNFIGDKIEDEVDVQRRSPRE